MNKMSDIRQAGTGKSVERALGALQGEYVIVPRRRILSWRLWLVMGLIVGIIVALVVIARRSARDSEEATDEPSSFRTSL